MYLHAHTNATTIIGWTFYFAIQGKHVKEFIFLFFVKFLPFNFKQSIDSTCDNRNDECAADSGKICC